MVSKCHNPRCSSEFRYFGEGKLYEFLPDSAKDSSELFWLCDTCAQRHSLKRDGDGVVQLIAKDQNDSAHLLRERRRIPRAS